MAQVSGGGGSAESYVPEGDRAAAMVSGGRFRFEPDAVVQPTQGVEAALDKLDAILTEMDFAGQVSPLGSDPFSAAATEKFRDVANGDGAALLAAHTQFEQVLLDTRDALQNTVDTAVAQAGSTAQGFGTSS